MNQDYACVNVKNHVSVDPESLPNDKVMSGQGHVQLSKVLNSTFYNKYHTSAQIESLVVRPLCQNIKIFKANAQGIMTRS